MNLTEDELKQLGKDNVKPLSEEDCLEAMKLKS